MKCSLLASLVALGLSGCEKERDGNPRANAPADRGRSTIRSAEFRARSHSGGLKAIFNQRENLQPHDEEAASRLKSDITSLDTADLIRLLEEASGTRNSPKGRLVFTVAIAELARREPNSVMDWFSPAEMVRSEAGWIEVAGILAKSNPDILETWLLQDLKDGSKTVQRECLSFGLMSLSAVDPAAALAFSSKVSGEIVPNSEVISAIFLDFGRQSPLAADAAAAARFKGMDLDQARYTIAIGASAKDPASGIECARKIADLSLRGEAIATGLSNWMESDQPAALKRLQELSSSELQVALQAALGTPNSLVNKLGKNNPDLLCNILDSMVVTSSNQKVFKAAVDSLTLSSPEKATELIESLPGGEMKNALLASQFRTIAAANPAAALDQASKMPKDGMRAQAFAAIGDNVGADGLEPTLRMAQSLSASDKSAFFSAALPHIVYQNPRETAELLTSKELPLDPGMKFGMLANVGERLGGADSVYAQDWLGKLQPNDQPQAMKGIAMGMAKSDIEGLATLLGSRAKDKAWEAGVRVLVQNIKDSDPEMAKQWQGALGAAGYK